MRQPLLFAIRIYWRLVPHHRRRACLFSETCSLYVYRVTHTKGLILGLAALAFRFRRCRPHYSITFDEQLSPTFWAADGNAIALSDLSGPMRALIQSARSGLPADGAVRTVLPGRPRVQSLREHLGEICTFDTRAKR
jgi:putative component of membrane protein insertase Oxa1/YidC/SpoIIIJ protein YidD